MPILAWWEGSEAPITLRERQVEMSVPDKITLAGNVKWKVKKGVNDNWVKETKIKSISGEAMTHCLNFGHI